jgi:hypothetical protein
MPPKKPKTAPASRKVPKITYVIKWDPDRRRFIALDDASALLGLSQTQGVAIGVARTAAINAARLQGAQVSVVVEDENGKRKKQWTFAPPNKHIPKAKEHGD